VPGGPGEGGKTSLLYRCGTEGIFEVTTVETFEEAIRLSVIGRSRLMVNIEKTEKRLSEGGSKLWAMIGSTGNDSRDTKTGDPGREEGLSTISS
jgi:hypothetical protein